MKIQLALCYHKIFLLVTWNSVLWQSNLFDKKKRMKMKKARKLVNFKIEMQKIIIVYSKNTNNLLYKYIVQWFGCMNHCFKTHMTKVQTKKNKYSFICQKNIGHFMEESLITKIICYKHKSYRTNKHKS